MVLDKFQVRTTGPVDPVTRQPVKVSFFSSHKCEHKLNMILSRVVNGQEESGLGRWSGML